MHLYNKALGTTRFFFLASAWLTFIENRYRNQREMEMTHLEKLVNFESFTTTRKETLKDESGGLSFFSFGIFKGIKNSAEKD